MSAKETEWAQNSFLETNESEGSMVTCPENEGGVTHLYMWFWYTNNTSNIINIKYNHNFLCLNNDQEAEDPKIPLCPIFLCEGEECQTCLGWNPPKQIEIDEEDIYQKGFDVLEYERETGGEGGVEYELNFYTEFYEGTKESMVGVYETVAGYFGFGHGV
jgi:hypothetical protein